MERPRQRHQQPSYDYSDRDHGNAYASEGGRRQNNGHRDNYDDEGGSQPGDDVSYSFHQNPGSRRKPFEQRDGDSFGYNFEQESDRATPADRRVRSPNSNRPYGRHTSRYRDRDQDDQSFDDAGRSWGPDNRFEEGSTIIPEDEGPQRYREVPRSAIRDGGYAPSRTPRQRHSDGSASLSRDRRTPLTITTEQPVTERPQFWTPIDTSAGSVAAPAIAPAKASGSTFFHRLLSSFRQPKAAAAVTTAQPTVQLHKLPSAKTNDKQKSGLSKTFNSDRNAGALQTAARILLLDGEEVTLPVDRNTVGQDLFARVCQHTDVVETDYFGLTYVSEKVRTWLWLDLEKKISKQIVGGVDYVFYFQVKFYPPEPSLLQEEITRYQLTLQIRQDIFTGKLPCSWVTQALLGSFMVQSELGDFDAELHVGTGYLTQFEFVRSPTEQLLQKIAELHMTHKGMTPGQADIKYLETAKRLELYGVDLHPARDMEDVEIYLGVGFGGFVIYRDHLRIGRFAWPKVLNISFSKNNFYLKIRPDYTEPVEAVVGFRLLNVNLAKRLWKVAVEHHTFFRLKEPRLPKRSPATLFGGSLRSQHRYTGRTFFQYRTMNVDRARHTFDRSLIKHQTGSVPSNLNTGGMRYNSMHSLHRTHPRDMTMGKTQSVEYLGQCREPFQSPRPSNMNGSVASRSTSRLRPSQGARSTDYLGPPSDLQAEGSLLQNTVGDGDSFLDRRWDDFSTLPSRPADNGPISHRARPSGRQPPTSSIASDRSLPRQYSSRRPQRDPREMEQAQPEEVPIASSYADSCSVDFDENQTDSVLTVSQRQDSMQPRKSRRPAEELRVKPVPRRRHQSEDSYTEDFVPSTREQGRYQQESPDEQTPVEENYYANMGVHRLAGLPPPAPKPQSSKPWRRGNQATSRHVSDEDLL